MSGYHLTNSKIVAAYKERTNKSAKLAQSAYKTFPSGITHDSRHTQPYGIYVDHAKGSRKWDVDGNEYVDYFGGHGALILGSPNSRARSIGSEVPPPPQSKPASGSCAAASRLDDPL